MATDSMLVNNSIGFIAYCRPRFGAGDNRHIESKEIVYWVTQVLLAAKISFRGLNGGVTKQELNLLDFAAVRVAEFRAGSAQIVWSDVLKPSFLAAPLDHVPHHILRDAITPEFVGASDSAEDSSLGDSRCRCPLVECCLHPDRNWHSADVSAFPDQIHDGPMTLPHLHVIHLQSDQF
jgi:hypothetical protein